MTARRCPRLIAMFSAVVLTVGAASRGGAQTSSGNQWQFTVTPYLLLPYMKGDVGIGPIPPVTVDVAPSDIFSRLTFGAMLNLQAKKGAWAIMMDGLYMNLSQEILPDATRISGAVGMKQSAFQLLGLREVAPGIELGLSGRLNVIDASIDVQSNGSNSTQHGKSGSQVWFDPLLAARFTVQGTGKWHLSLETDAGGFGVGSTFAWQVAPVVGYRFSKTFELVSSFRALGMDYSSGEGAKAFSYDMRIYGPLLGFAFRF